MTDRQKLTRRAFLKIAGAGCTTLYLGSCASVARDPGSSGELATRPFLQAHGPFDRGLPGGDTGVFSGDSPERAHALLWDSAQAGRKLATLSERAPVVVVGGGMSGLFAAYLLRDLKPVILEQHVRFGGNARGESWQGIDYSLGAAYFSAPETGSKLESLYRELGVPELCRVRDEEDPVELSGRLIPSVSHESRPFRKYLARLASGAEPMPQVPPPHAAARRIVDEIDRYSLEQYLAHKVGTLPNELKVWLEYYFWSSMNASCREISAASGVNFLAGESGSIWVAPGGNGAVAERILEKLQASLPAGHLKPSSVVTSVETTDGGVRVTYSDSENRMQSIDASAVVMACPKFIVGRILKDIEPERLNAIRRLKYRGYLVANLLLKGASAADFYDLYLLGDGKTPKEGAVTDVIHGSFAAKSKSSTVLTLYRSIPVDGARARLLAEDFYSTTKREFETLIEASILKLPPFRGAKIEGLRMSRWGHPIPISEQGLFSGRVVDAVRKPFRKRVFFVEQDNWATPAMETGALEAIAWESEIRKAIV